MKCKRILAAIGLSAALVGGAAAAPNSENVAEGISAIVNDEIISTYDVRQRANLLLIGANIEQTEEVMERVRAQALRDLIDERIQIQEAREQKIVIGPEEIDRNLADIAQQNRTDVAGLAASLARDGVDISTLRSQLEAEMAWRILVRRQSGRVRISDDRIRETQERIAANATKPQYRLAEILIRADTEDEYAQAMGVADRLLQEIKKGAPFSAVARQFSGSPTAAAGGDLGWLAQSELRPDLQRAVEVLEPNQISAPFPGSGGVYLVALLDKREGVDLAANTRVTLRQVTAPASRRNALERQLGRIEGCANLERAVGGVEGAQVVDLGEALESELSDAVRERIAKAAVGAATPIVVEGGSADALVVCQRASEGAGVPSLAEIEDRLMNQEVAMIAERYLRNLRRDSTIITR